MSSREPQRRLHAYLHRSVEQWPGGNMQDRASRPQPYNARAERLVILEAAGSTLLWMRALDDCLRGYQEYDGWSEYTEARKDGSMPDGAFFKWSGSINSLVLGSRFAANKIIHVATPVVPAKDSSTDVLEGWVWAGSGIYPVRTKGDDRSGLDAYHQSFEGRRVEKPLTQLLHWFNWWSRWLDEQEADGGS